MEFICREKITLEQIHDAKREVYKYNPTRKPEKTQKANGSHRIDLFIN